jgi:hypothetical protein
MANPEHVKRTESPPPGFGSGVGWDLKGLDLNQADLSGRDLSAAEMSDTDMTFAKLIAARFFGTIMDRTALMYADLSHAHFSHASLREANLHGAILMLARLHGTRLDGADLTNATCGSTSFSSCDLSQTKGLSRVRHATPSSIGIDTLSLTLEGAGGRFAAEQVLFFEAAGVPRALLDYLPDLLEAQPIQFFSCFISYGGEDGDFADQLYRNLKTRGIRCWKYDADAIIGRGVWANISRAIVLHEKTIVICSQSSLQRPAVQREIERALQREDELTSRQAAQPDVMIDTDILFPVRLDDYVLHGWEHPRKADVVAKHIGDFREWRVEAQYEKAFEQLLRALDPRSKLGLSRLV